MNSMQGEATHYFKVLVNGKSSHGGSLAWSLPTQGADGAWQPGDWHRVKGKLVACENGIHLCTWEQVWQTWMKIDADIYHAEPDAECLDEGDKLVTRGARLLKPVANEEYPAWWFAAREQIMALKDVRWFQPDGNPLPEWKLFTAPTWGAAWDAARGAARDAARDAAWDAAWGAAWDAARDAARDAAWGAAWDAARDAARGAAWDAAWGAALYIGTEFICADLQIDEKHREYVRRRWQAYQKGYAVLCDVDGVLYVYAAQEVAEAVK